MTAENQSGRQMHRTPVALLGAIPADIETALRRTFNLIDKGALAALAERERQSITRGVTSAMGGVSDEMLEDLPGLVTIASAGAGMDKFDLPRLSARGIDVHPTPGVMTEDTAEFAIGLVFALLRNIVSNDSFVRRGDWAATRAPLGQRISGRKIGIVGLGRIGSRIAGKLSALGCEISYSGPSEKDVPWRYEPALVDLARVADVLILSCAGGKATRGIVNSTVLGLLGPEGYLVSVSRGSVVDEAALIAALESSKIAGAALDVFENEPTPNPRFMELRNCILQPHAAVFTRENRLDLVVELERLLQA